MTPKLDKQLASVGGMSPTELREAWTEHYGSEPPALPPSLLAMGLAYGLQAQRLGGLERRIVKHLDRVADAIEAREAAVHALPSAMAGAGTRLVREWGGQVHHVQMLDGGTCVYQGKVHGSLSEVARLITGTRWSGPRFFGLPT